MILRRAVESGPAGRIWELDTDGRLWFSEPGVDGRRISVYDDWEDFWRAHHHPSIQIEHISPNLIVPEGL